MTGNRRIPEGKQIWILRFAVFFCFIAHGTLAIKASSNFGTEWSNWVQRLFVEENRYVGSQTFLGVVGAIDFLMGSCFLLPEIPFAAFVWAIMWGTATALSRIFFLWSAVGPLWAGRVHPIAEFLLRIPNGLIPFVLFLKAAPQFLSQNSRDRVFSLWPVISVVTQVLGLLLNYFATWRDPFYPFEVEKFSKPLWYFHLNGSLALLSLITFAIYAGWRNTRSMQRMVVFLCAVCFGMFELFDIAIINAPIGFWYTAFRIAEHAPIYGAFAFLIYACTYFDYKSTECRR